MTALKGHSSKRNSVTAVIVHTVLIACTLAAVFPLFWVVRTSLGTRADSISVPPKLWFVPTLDNYLEVLGGPFPQFLLHSLVIVAATVVVTMVLGVLAGYSMARFERKSHEGWFFYLITTRMGPPVVFALPYYVAYQAIGIYDSFLGLIIIYAAINTALAAWMSRSFFQDLPASLEEAAMIEGLSRIGAFVRVTLPLARSGLTATATFVFIMAWNEFFYASVLTQRAARTFTTQLPTFISFSRIHWEEMAAAATLGMLPVIIFAILVRKQLIRGFTFGQVG